jgi:hypothetical protein
MLCVLHAAASPAFVDVLRVAKFANFEFIFPRCTSDGRPRAIVHAIQVWWQQMPPPSYIRKIKASSLSDRLQAEVSDSGTYKKCAWVLAVQHCSFSFISMLNMPIVS